MFRNVSSQWLHNPNGESHFRCRFGQLSSSQKGSRLKADIIRHLYYIEYVKLRENSKNIISKKILWINAYTDEEHLAFVAYTLNFTLIVVPITKLGHTILMFYNYNHDPASNVRVNSFNRISGYRARDALSKYVNSVSTTESTEYIVWST